MGEKSHLLSTSMWCRRKHQVVSESDTLFFPGFFQCQRNNRGDSGSRTDREQFLQFFAEVHPEFCNFGPLQNFKVCCNVWNDGGVFVQYACREDASCAYQAMQHRYFDGRRVR
eukprot:TRINITY_DN9744_c0_g4_i3.p1 TRINITY_DN9744_c0_g4~~TRINITY_DN9744_c0_g4_i3.p1  ORF type:complete len:122 (-),score=21.16 TRINITY_DN9744_c0_g4_i3:260-598(-)